MQHLVERYASIHTYEEGPTTLQRTHRTSAEVVDVMLRDLECNCKGLHDLLCQIDDLVQIFHASLVELGTKIFRPATMVRSMLLAALDNLNYKRLGPWPKSFLSTAGSSNGKSLAT